MTGFRRPAFGRKRLPPELVPAERAFRQVLEVLEPAKESLADVLPTNRLPGRPLVDALGGFEGALVTSQGLMAAWRRLEVADVWQRCAEGLDLALERARRLRTEAPDLGGFEGLLGTIQSLLDPLDPFEEAAERFRRLRRRPAGWPG